MLHRFHDRFGTAGVVIGVIALIAALGGTALAAGGLTKSQEKQVTKIAKKFAGKPGAPGPTGPAGTNGTNGKDGANGTNGSPGTSGESVKVTPEGECTKFSNASGTGEACNGTTGFTEHLPSEKTETGVWSMFNEAAKAGEGVLVQLSFNIPLATVPTAVGATNFLGPEEGEGEPKENTTAIPSHCKGTVANPEAVPGNLCVFTKLALNATKGAPALGAIFADPQTGEGETTAGTTGALLGLHSEAAGFAGMFGTWAVTAE